MFIEFTYISISNIEFCIPFVNTLVSPYTPYYLPVRIMCTIVRFTVYIRIYIICSLDTQMFYVKQCNIYVIDDVTTCYISSMMQFNFMKAIYIRHVNRHGSYS